MDCWPSTLGQRKTGKVLLVVPQRVRVVARERHHIESMVSIVRAHGSAARTIRAMHPECTTVDDRLPPDVRTYGGALRATARNATDWCTPGRAPPGRQATATSRTPMSQTSSE